MPLDEKPPLPQESVQSPDAVPAYTGVPKIATGFAKKRYESPGKWKPGMSPNPLGRAAIVGQVIGEHRKNVPMIVRKLYRYCLRALAADAPHAVPAVREYLDRVVGRVPQQVIEKVAAPENEVEHIWEAMSEEQLDAVIASGGKLPDDIEIDPARVEQSAADDGRQQ